MRRCLAVLVTATAATFIGAPAALACGGLVAPNGAVKLVNTTTLVAYHDGVEHYVTSFEYAGGGTRFGSIIPLPGVPTSVTRGGSWTLQRLELEVHPPAPEAFNGPAPAAFSAAGPAQVLLRTQVDALTITVIKGGGPAVTAWVRQQGFKVSPDLPAMLNFYAVRSPIFLTATFDPAAEAARGLHLGDGTPVDIAIPLSNPWVPLHILSLAKDPDDIVRADVFMLSDHQPALLSGPGVQLRVSRPAEPALLNDLRSDRGMGWIPSSAWLSYITVDARASSLTYDLAADVSGNGHPSLTAAALVPAVTLRVPTSDQSGWWPIAVLVGIGFLMLLPGTLGYLDRRRRA
jgi:Uncharacterized protein conserved in bacteria (DUF2330)